MRRRNSRSGRSAPTGSLLLHPDHQEVHLQSAGPDDAGQTVADRAEHPRRRSSTAPTRSTVKNLDARRTAISRSPPTARSAAPGDALEVTLDQRRRRQRRRAAAAAAAAHRPPERDGTVTGTKDAPQVKAEFQVDQGGFRKFRYDSFGGTVDYAGTGVTLDTRLQQNADDVAHREGLCAGRAFSAASAAEREAAHGVETAGEDRIDLHVDSTPIDLGLVQGFTTRADQRHRARCRRTSTSPARPPIRIRTAIVTIDNAAFTRRADRRQLHEPDGHDRAAARPGPHRRTSRCSTTTRTPLSITGDLAVHERAARRRPALRHRRRLQGHRQQAGQRPDQQRRADRRRAAGAAHRRRSRRHDRPINLDQILALVGDSAYATEPDRVPDDAGRERPPAAAGAARRRSRR